MDLEENCKLKNSTGQLTLYITDHGYDFQKIIRRYQNNPKVVINKYIERLQLSINLLSKIIHSIPDEWNDQFDLVADDIVLINGPDFIIKKMVEEGALLKYPPEGLDEEAYWDPFRE
jgi:hypothetical protein